MMEGFKTVFYKHRRHRRASAESS